jgi:hypothetical protein
MSTAEEVRDYSSLFLALQTLIPLSFTSQKLISAHSDLKAAYDSYTASRDKVMQAIEDLTGEPFFLSPVRRDIIFD